MSLPSGTKAVDSGETKTSAQSGVNDRGQSSGKRQTLRFNMAKFHCNESAQNFKGKVIADETKIGPLVDDGEPYSEIGFV